MTEQQQYRVIADRDKGDDPQWMDVHRGDRYTAISDHIGLADEDDPLVRIERPVPTEPCLSTAHHDAHEWGAHADQPGSGYWCRGFDAFDESPHQPTREYQRTIREFHGNDVWRDDEGTAWVRQEQLVRAVELASPHREQIADELEYRVRTAVTRARAAEKNNEQYPREFVDRQIANGRARVLALFQNGADR